MAAKVWTVRAKRRISSEIPEGLTIQVTTPNGYIDWNALEKAVRAQGLMNSGGGVFNAGYWDWH